MSRGIGEPLDLSSRRYWRQNAEMAVRDIFDALIEIITNADDRYVWLGVPKGRIEIEVERRRKETPSIIRVRDFADGMTVDDMKLKLQKVAGRVSGLQEGKSVRGTFSRGAKDVAVLGGVAFDSIARDGRFHHCEITAQGMFHVDEPSPKASVSHRKQLKIMEGTGTVVTMLVDSEVIQVPQHDTLRQKLGQLVSLRDILNSPDREVTIYDLGQERSDLIKPPYIAGYERVNERFRIPGYDNVEAKITIKRATSALQDGGGLRFRTSGILVKSRHAIHEATLFASDLENDAYAKRFFGKLTCEYIDELSDDWDDRFEKGLPPTASNPRPILDPVRKQGLSREHPFVEKLYKEALGSVSKQQSEISADRCQL